MNHFKPESPPIGEAGQNAMLLVPISQSYLRRSSYQLLSNLHSYPISRQMEAASDVIKGLAVEVGLRYM